MEYMLDTEFNPGAFAAQIGGTLGGRPVAPGPASGLSGIQYAVRAAVHRPAVQQRRGLPERLQQHELRHGKKTIDGILHYVRMRHDSARAQLKWLRQRFPRTADGFPQAAERLPRAA